MTRDRRLCRAARGLVLWSQQDLADRANLSLSTVRAFESGEYVHRNHVDAMQRALSREGVMFSTDERGNMWIRLRVAGEAVYEIVRHPQD